MPRARAALAALGLFVGSCITPQGAPPRVYATASSTIVLAPDEQTVWVASPDDDQVVQLTARDLVVGRRVDVAGEPTQLALAGATLVVTLAQATDVALVDTATGAVRRVSVPCGGTRAVVALPAGRAWVTCPSDDLLVEIDTVSARVTRVLAAPGRPTALAVAGDVLVVTASRTGTARAYSLAQIAAGVAGTADAPAAPTALEERAMEETPGRAASQLDALAAEPQTGRFFAAFQRVDRDTDRARPPERGGYGAVDNGAPRIEPRVFAPCGARYARFDGGADVFSGPSALAWGAGGLLWVANQYTDNVAVLRCPLPAGAPDAAHPLRASVPPGGDSIATSAVTFRVGRGPRGIALSADGARAFVDVGFDAAVARIELGTAADGSAPGRVLDATLVRRRDRGATRLTPAALAGRAIFHDAVNTHLTPSGVVACASCHPGGGDDGLTWFLHTVNVPRKLRRTPPAWGARAELLPLHWDGGFADAVSLTRSTIVELMGGDGLLVDADAVSAYLASLRPPPPPPLTDAQRARVDRGRALFASPAVGCATCHAGALFSDARAHESVLAPASDADAALDLVDTPSLVGVRALGPYLHDGRAATLREVFAMHNAGDAHGRTRALDASALDDLVAFLASL